jgi:hypothetical protein
MISSFWVLLMEKLQSETRMVYQLEIDVHAEQSDR